MGFDHESKKTDHTITPEKELVVASLVGDDISWLDEPFSDWKTNIYVVNDPNASLTVPKNKGTEVMAYLTYARHCLSVYHLLTNLFRYIIDRYYTFPDVAVFIHSLRYQWHNEDPMYGMQITATLVTLT